MIILVCFTLRYYNENVIFSRIILKIIQLKEYEVTLQIFTTKQYHDDLFFNWIAFFILHQSKNILITLRDVMNNVFFLFAQDF